MNLVGYADKVIQGVTLSQCRKSCEVAETEHSMICNSFMFYPQFGDCILNTPTKHTEGVYFTTNQQTDYYENICNKSESWVCVTRS